ncbi:MAG: META domain-containing protein [Methanoregulaceae archaeon]|nr:META domain-containing protein [Methanoregulaceae archaeon]
MKYRIPALILLLALFYLLSGCFSIPGLGPPSRDLTGVSWVLVSYDDGKNNFVSVPSATDIALVFEKDGKLTGNAGCNDYFGDYSLDGGLITISSLASAEKYCPSPEGVMDLEQHYLALLQQTTRYNIDGDELVLSYYDVKRLLIFRKGV